MEKLTFTERLNLVLVLGNGFDIACGLPTRYLDFLYFAKYVSAICANPYERLYYYDINDTLAIELDLKISPKIDQVFYNPDGSIRDKVYRQWSNLLSDNYWIKRFCIDVPYQRGDKWIDFENEIKRVISTIDLSRRRDDLRWADMDEEIIFDSSKDSPLSHIIEEIRGEVKDVLWKEKNESHETLKTLLPLIYSCGHKQKFTYNEIREKLYSDLQRLIKAMNLYFSDIIEPMLSENKELPADISDIIDSVTKADTVFVVSFNYTHTFQRLLEFKGIKSNVKYCYIHGETSARSTDGGNNLVLGIEEYLADKLVDSYEAIGFSEFKKWHQRMFKDTDTSYYYWTDGYDQEPADMIVYGHSLGSSDKEILQPLFEAGWNSSTKIYYYDEKAKREEISNMAYILGKEEFERRTKSKFRTIIFEKCYGKCPAGLCL